MRISAALSLLLAGAALATPAVDLKTLFCKVNNDIIKVLDKDASATQFCSSYLSIPTSTISTTVYETPSSVYLTLPVTVTGEASTTTETSTATSTSYAISTTTVVQTNYMTITRTTSTTTLTCLSKAYTYMPPVGSILPAEPSINAVADKRGLFFKKPDCIPANWPKAHVSNACKCLQIQAPSTTLTFTETLATGTITMDSTIIETPTATAFETTTEVPVSTVTATATSTTVITNTAFAVETSIAQGPLNYYRYSHNFDANLENPGFTAEHFKGKIPIISGTTTTTWFAATRLLQFSGYPAFEAYQSAVLFQGYFVAPESGTFTFQSPAEYVNNWGYLWVGDAAFNWNEGNTAFKSSNTGAAPITAIGGSFPVVMKKGDALPFTYLWANGGGDGRSYLVVKRPNGQVVTLAPALLAAACPGTF